MKKLEVKKSIINGKGLFVTSSYKKNQFIAYIHGPKVLVREFTPYLSRISMNWIGATRFTWINTSNSLFRYINHSCNPNVAIKGERTVYALRDIKAGEEIMMDYSLTESDEQWCITCHCLSSNCRKTIGPITTLSQSTFKKYSPIITEQFKKIYKSSI